MDRSLLANKRLPPLSGGEKGFKSALMLGLLLPTAQVLTVRSVKPELRKLLPDSCITTSRTLLVWPSNVALHRPLPRSHSLAVLSNEPLTAVRQFPSMSTENTVDACPAMVRTHLLVRRSHSRTVWSNEPDRTVLTDALMQ